jgi:hypothetical protein
MAAIQLRGTWRLRVLGKDSDWPQRVMIGGSTSMVIPGQIGASAVIHGDRWFLTVEHHDNGAWHPNVTLNVADGQRQGRATKTLTTKDTSWSGRDLVCDDLVIELEEAPQAGEFTIVGIPVGVDGGLHPVASQAVGDPMARYLAVTVANSGSDDYSYDAVLDITASSRQALASQGIEVPRWTTAAVTATRQETTGSGVAIPQLAPGEQATIYFPVSPSRARPGAVSLEFELRNAGRAGTLPQSRSCVVQAAAPPPTPAGRDAVAGGHGVAMVQAMAGGGPAAAPPPPGAPVPPRPPRDGGGNPPGPPRPPGNDGGNPPGPSGPPRGPSRLGTPLGRMAQAQRQPMRPLSPRRPTAPDRP